jgi:hypothetical protein
LEAAGQSTISQSPASNIHQPIGVLNAPGGSNFKCFFAAMLRRTTAAIRWYHAT